MISMGSAATGVYRYFVIGIILCLATFGGITKPVMAETIELKFAHHLPPGVDVTRAFEEWGGLVEKRTGGMVKVTMYPAESLSKASDFYRSTVKGICDISFGPCANDPSRFPLTMVTDLPGVPFPNLKAANKIRQELFDKFAEMRAEFKEVKILWRWVGAPAVVHTTKETVRVPNDLKGVKMISVPPDSFALKGMGASPISLLPPDWYMALERGVAGGVVAPYNVIYAHRLYTLTRYHTESSISSLGFQVIMNLKKWNSLPPDVRKVMEDLCSWGAERCTELIVHDVSAARDACLKDGHAVFKPSFEEIQLWSSGCKPVQEEWVKDVESKQLPGTAVMKELYRLVGEHGK